MGDIGKRVEAFILNIDSGKDSTIIKGSYESIQATIETYEKYDILYDPTSLIKLRAKYQEWQSKQPSKKS